MNPLPPIRTQAVDQVLRNILWVNCHARMVGGAERYIHDTARALRGHGISSTLLYSVESRPDPDFLRPFSAAFPVVELSTQIRSLAPDVVYVHQVGSPDWAKDLVASNVATVRFFHDHRDFCLREHKYTTVRHATCTRCVGMHCYACLGFLSRSSDSGLLRLQSVAGLRRRVAPWRGVEGVVVGSQYMRDHVVSHGFDRERVHAVPLFTDPPPSGSRVERDPSQLLFSGQLVRGKGLDLALRALSVCRTRPRLIVAGGGRQRDALQVLTRKLGLDGRVSFVGHQNTESLNRLVSSCAALLMPSRSPETFGLSGLEALSRATPVIGSRVGGMGEWLLDGITGLTFQSGNVPELAEAIDRMVTEPIWARVLGANGRRLFYERFTPSHHVERLIPVLIRSMGRIT